MKTAPTDSSSQRPRLAPLRESRLALLAALIASFGLTMLGLDGLTSGHFHVEEGSLLHHRHLFNGEHDHREVAPRLAEQDDHDDHADSDDDGDHEQEGSDGRSPGTTVSTLELAGSLAAEYFVTFSFSEPVAEPLLPAIVVAAIEQFSPTEGPRPPPLA